MNNCIFNLEYQYVDGKTNINIGEHENKNRILPFCVAVSVTEGEYFVDFNCETVCIKPGETIFIQSTVKHSVRMKNKGKLTYAHFLCCYAAIDIFALANIDFVVVDNKDIQKLLNRLNYKIYDNEIMQHMYTDKLLCELFLILFDMKIIDPKLLVIDYRLNNALLYIRFNLSQWITVDEVIKISGYSKTVFYRIFKSIMKVSPREYIETERFKIASTLLLEGKKVKEVAKAIGFNDVSYFNKVFKQKYGVTPIKYKQKINYTTRRELL